MAIDPDTFGPTYHSPPSEASKKRAMSGKLFTFSGKLRPVCT